MIALIVARSQNNVIGKNGKIPWHIKSEQELFKNITTDNVVVMGRKTYESIGHPLKNRFNIVISKTKKYEGENLVTVSSLNEALRIVQNRDVYIIGGYNIYKEAIPIVDRMYITEVLLDIEDGDVFFPEFNCLDFDIKCGKIYLDNIKYRQDIYIRRR